MPLLWPRDGSARTHTPVVATVHGRPTDALRQPERWTGHIVKFLLPFVFTHVDAVVAVSQGVADDIRRIVADDTVKVRVIGNPVISDDLVIRGARPSEHPWLAPTHEIPVVVWCGRLTAEKDPLAALHAVAAVRSRRPVRLMFVGDGPLRGQLEQRTRALGIDCDVAFTGFVDDPETYLAHSDVCLLTSRREGLPTVLIEALALGTPVVATDCPSGPSEILAHGALGQLVPLDDADALVVALERALAAPRPTAPPDALAAYTVEASSAHYLELLNELGVR